LIVDIHCHIGTYTDINQTFTCEDLLKSMRKYGIYVSVVSKLSKNTRADNDEVSEAVRKYPSRLIGFAHIDPADPGDPKRAKAALEEVERAVNSLGLKGVKFHPSRDGYFPFAEEVYTVMKRIEELKLPVLWHTGPSSVRAFPLQIAYVAKDFPKVPFILGHMGLMGAAEAVPAAKLSGNIYLETAACAETAVIELAIKELGAERFVWGTDQPYLHPSVELKKIEVLNISAEDRRKILGENAAKILGIKV